MIGHELATVVPLARRSWEVDVLRVAVLAGLCDSYETVRLCKDGREVTVVVQSSPIRDASGAIVGVSTIESSVAAVDRLPTPLADALLLGSFQDAPIGVALIAATPHNRGSVLQANPAFCRLVGMTKRELEARTLGSLVHVDDRDRVGGTFAKLAAEEVTEISLEARFVHANGHPVWVQMHSSLVRSQPGEPHYAVTHLQDVTDQKRFEGQLRYLADHDALTGLFNRRRLEDELERVVAHVKRYHEPAAC